MALTDTAVSNAKSKEKAYKCGAGGRGATDKGSLMKLHAFVVMPFGIKKDKKGHDINFNRVYEDLIRPALEAAGLVAFRADEELRAGEIRKDMFQELLVADLVVADLTLENPNVWYELGVRHALRARGVVLIAGGNVPTAFDVYTDRKLRYALKDGLPDAACLEDDRKALTSMTRETMESWHGRKISPVYDLLPNLHEPDWKALQIDSLREFREIHDAWKRSLDLARKEKHIGDMLLLAGEAPVSVLRAEAWINAGAQLRRAGHFEFALELLERGLRVEPDNKLGLQEKGICLQRLAISKTPGYSLERARTHYEHALEQSPSDPELAALLGRIDKDDWVASWRRDGTSAAERRDEAAYGEAQLRAAIDGYLAGFRADPRHYYSGVNALTLMHLLQDLTGNNPFSDEMNSLAGAVQFAAQNEPDDGVRFWALATLGDIEVLIGTPDSVTAAYKESIAHNRKDWFALDSSLAQLQLLEDLGFRPDNVAAGITTFERALQRLAPPSDETTPRKIFLFSGHMVDMPERDPPRFPTDKVPAAAQKIGDALDKLGACADDLALTQGACGGDLLFTEACQQRGVQVRWLQPFDEPEFIRVSVDRGPGEWLERYHEARERLVALVRSAPAALGPPPPYAGDGYAYERCNLWLLYTALTHGLDKLNFVSLWDGSVGDGPGGTAHMIHEVQEHGGRVELIDVRKL